LIVCKAAESLAAATIKVLIVGKHAESLAPRTIKILIVGGVRRDGRPP